MRRINKINSTKAERKFYEILKELKIPFKHRWIIGGMEVDFLIGNYVIEINGHDQSHERNNKFIRLGYVPIHFHNQEIKNNGEIIKIKLLNYDFKI